MSFAVIDSDLSYWRKQTTPLFDDLLWNLPERKSGQAAVIGGSRESFATPIRLAEFMTERFPLAHVATILPDSLQNKLPPLANVNFVLSTTSGSIDRSPKLKAFARESNLVLLAGDCSRNSATAVALAEVLQSDEAKDPTEVSSLCVIARDSVDLLATEAGRWLTRPNTIVIASMAQLQKIFRAVYYPRMIMLSQPLLPAVETLHKFTLSYDVTLLTFHQEQIIVAHRGQISTTPLVQTNYTPISLWSGQLAATVGALNLYNPGKPFEATTAAVLYH